MSFYHLYHPALTMLLCYGNGNIYFNTTYHLVQPYLANCKPKLTSLLTEWGAALYLVEGEWKISKNNNPLRIHVWKCFTLNHWFSVPVTLHLLLKCQLRNLTEVLFSLSERISRQPLGRWVTRWHECLGWHVVQIVKGATSDYFELPVERGLHNKQQIQNVLGEVVEPWEGCSEWANTGTNKHEHIHTLMLKVKQIPRNITHQE